MTKITETEITATWELFAQLSLQQRSDVFCQLFGMAHARALENPKDAFAVGFYDRTRELAAVIQKHGPLLGFSK